MSKNPNVTGQVVCAISYVKAPAVHTKEVTNPSGGVSVEGVNMKSGSLNADSINVKGNLTVEGLIINSRSLTPQTPAEARQLQAFQIRSNANQNQYEKELPPHDNNGDETLYPNKIANFSKGLPHNSIGEVNIAAYNTFLAAVADPTKFDLVVLPNAPWISPLGTGKWVNPICGTDFNLEGADPQALTVPPAPTFASAQQAGEMVEEYWMALLRDVNFADYATNPTALAACADLNNLSDFRGPKVSGLVTPQTLFRGSEQGCTIGPYVSQFFYLDCPYGANYIEQKARVPIAGNDFMKTFSSWLSIQNGNAPLAGQTFDSQLRYLRNGRDLSQWVHIDVLFQAYFQAALILMSLGCPLNPGNPYRSGHQNQIPFGSFGGPEIMASLSNIASLALKTCWYQKWQVQRRLRPEVYGGRVDRHKALVANYPFHVDLINSAVLPATFAANGNYLLPQVFPEGSPFHPSYTAGHATVAGACCTWLKAMFDLENFNIPNPVQPSADGLSLNAYIGTLSAYNEVHKIMANVGIGRNIAGVHWRSDYDESIKLGEDLAISVLRDRKLSYNPAESYGGAIIRKIDGTVVTI